MSSVEPFQPAVGIGEGARRDESPAVVVPSLQRVAQAAARVGREPDFERTSAAVVEQAVALGGRVAYLHLFEPATQSLVLAAHHGVPTYLLDGVRRIPLDGPWVVARVAHCRALVVASASSLDARLARTAELLPALRCSMVVSGPLMVRGELVGVLTWWIERAQDVTAADQAVIGAILEVFAGALAAARSHESERAMRARMDALSEANLVLGASRSAAQLLQNLVEQATLLSGAELAAVRAEQPERSPLVWFGVPAVRGGRGQGTLGIEPLLRWTASQGGPRRLAAGGLRAEPGLALPPDSTVASAIAIPLRVGDQLLATLCAVDSQRESGFSTDDERSLTLLGQVAAFALARVQSEELLRESRAELDREVVRRRRAEALAVERDGHVPRGDPGEGL